MVDPSLWPKGFRLAGRLVEHNNGIALVFARTETKMFFDHVWGKASGILFIQGRINFHRPDGTRASANSGAPSVLIAYGPEALRRLLASNIAGQLIEFESIAGVVA